MQTIGERVRGRNTNTAEHGSRRLKKKPQLVETKCFNGLQPATHAWPLGHDRLAGVCPCCNFELANRSKVRPSRDCTAPAAGSHPSPFSTSGTCKLATAASICLAHAVSLCV